MEYVSQLSRLKEFSRESAGPDVLFRADYDHVSGETCSQCAKAKYVTRDPRNKEVVVHYGTIPSGNKVIKNALESHPRDM